MSTNSDPAHPSSTDVRKALLWIALILAFLLLSVVRPLLGETLMAVSTRTASFNASGTIRSLTVKTVTGNVAVTAGPTFAASVSLTVKADTKERADKVLQETKAVFENENGKLFLTVEEPQSRIITLNGKKRLATYRHGNERYRVESRFTVTVPPGTTLSVSTVNGAVETKGVTAGQELRTVNGKIDVSGARQGLKLKTVNGAVHAACADLPADGRLDAETVNGDVVIVLPAASGFRLNGKTMNGTIASTFPLPMRGSAAGSFSEREMRLALRETEREKLRAAREKARAERDKARIESHRAEGEGGDWDSSMEEFSRQMESFGREMGRIGAEIARSVTVNVNRSYDGSVGSGSASVRCSTLNGKILILAEGSRPFDARNLIPRDKVVTVHVPGKSVATTIIVDEPQVSSRPPKPPKPPRAPKVVSFPGEETETRLGDIEGDFSSTAPFGDIVVGRVSGFARIRSRSGQITLREAVKGADLSASGGDVKVDAVGGNLEARTLGGNVTVGSVAGSAKLETMGGDITVRSAGGAVTARTAGGDIVVRKAAGPVNAETLGGAIVCEVTGKGPAGAELTSGGGDVTLTLPSGTRADVDIQVNGAESENQIRSDFTELSVSRRGGTVRAEGKLNGGGPHVVIRATSGTVTLKRGPAA